MNRKWIWTCAVVFSIVAVLFLVSPDIAYAAPGGLIKAAARSTVGKILFGLLVVALLPLIIAYMVRRAKAVKKAHATLNTLSQQYPHYGWLHLKDCVTSAFHWTWAAWTEQKMSKASDFTTPWYWQNQQLQLDEWERRGVENICHVVKINNITPLYVQHVAANNGEGSRVVVSINAVVVDYLQEKATGKVVQGDKKEGDLETIWTFVRQEGSWKLNLIEASDMEGQYLGLTMNLPEPVVAPNAVTS